MVTCLAQPHCHTDCSCGITRSVKDQCTQPPCFKRAIQNSPRNIIKRQTLNLNVHLGRCELSVNTSSNRSKWYGTIQLVGCDLLETHDPDEVPGSRLRSLTSDDQMDFCHSQPFLITSSWGVILHHRVLSQPASASTNG